MVGRLTNMMYSENSIKKIEDALDNLIQEDNYFLEDCYHHETHFEKRFHFETGAVVSYVGYYLYSEQKKISCDNWLNESIKKIVDEFPSVGFPIDDISITSVLLNFLDSSKNVNCVHICSDGCIYVKTETNENKGEKGISIEDFIHEYLVFDSIEEKEQKKQKIQSVFDYHISILKHIETQDISSINPKSSLYREILKKRKINKYFSFFPFYYYGSCYKRVFFVLTILQSDYLYPEFDDEGECVVESHPPIIESDKVLKIQLYLQSALWQLLQDRLSYEKRKSVSESLKSAVSAIMTRNMSHNLGSHYLHYTKTQLEQLAKKGGEFGPDIRGAARVMGYMQGRMDYLATLISMDRYPYGCVNFKSQIFDELTIDDFSKRHFDKEKASRTTNFLLSNLILSEGFTRSHIFNDDENIGNSINLHILFDNQIFTGIPILIEDPELDQLISREKKEGLSKEESKRKKELVDEKSRKEARKRKEEQAKQALTNINIAMPGGVMSCHAFFNVIENFIRNSAKYHQADFAKEDDKPFITITIKIEEKTEGNFDLYEFTIYDNKHNAYSKEIVGGKSTTLLELINNKFETLCILDENNAIEKSNKGFKEMLFSTIWMRTFIFMREENKNLPTNYSDVLATIQSSPNGSKKLELIQKYGFSVIAVDDKGNECPAKSNKHANLALRFTLPKFKKQVVVKLSNNKNDAINSLLNVYGDITNVSQKSLYELIKKINIGKDSSLVIPRMVDKTYATDVKALEKVLKNRFKGFDNYKLSIDGAQEGNIIVKKPSHSIYFKKHLSTKSNMKYFRKYAYADSISGGNFTLTLSEIFNRWKENGWDTSTPEYYEILKIKESALTRITLIDERLYNEMLNQDNGVELACKNIRILNYHEPNSTKNFGDFKKLFIGNKFNLGRKYTHFLSIHLGLIEKIVQDSKAFKSLKDECGKEYGKYPIEERTIKFMNLLQKYFGDKNQKVFICIHSGRGNFSAELNGPLSTYPFISMSALENAYNNSKYLLSQLFYSIIYLGKGTINH